MNNESLEGLRRKLQRRFERLGEAHRRTMFDKLKLLWEFIESEPLLCAIVEHLISTAKMDMQHYAFAFFSIPEHFNLQGMPQPQTEEETAMVAAIFVKACTDQWPGRGRIGPAEFRNALVNLVANDDNATHVKITFVNPLWDYIQDKLDDLQFLVARILQYKHRCEWFERKHLMEIVGKEQHDNPGYANVEQALKMDLYRYLHDQGITFFVEPYSEKGRIDLILDQTKENKTYIEAKVFDNKSRRKSDVRDGFGQLWGYMDKYQVTVGYLVVYNISDCQLVFNGEQSESGIAVFRRGHLSIYAVPIEIYVHDSPASQRKDKYVEISNQDLPLSLDEVTIDPPADSKHPGKDGP